MSTNPIIGGDLVQLLTAGMYNNPLVLYREYLQNAIDSIASSDNNVGCVQITIDPLRARIKIRDNGIGLSPEQAVQQLLDIGRSKKGPFISSRFPGNRPLVRTSFR